MDSLPGGRWWLRGAGWRAHRAAASAPPLEVINIGQALLHLKVAGLLHLELVSAMAVIWTGCRRRRRNPRAAAQTLALRAALLPLATPWPRDEASWGVSRAQRGQSTVDAYATGGEFTEGEHPSFFFHAGSHLPITSDWPSL